MCHFTLSLKIQQIYPNLFKAPVIILIKIHNLPPAIQRINIAPIEQYYKLKYICIFESKSDILSFIMHIHLFAFTNS